MTKTTKMFRVEGGMGRLMQRASSAEQAKRMARRKYGSVNEPYSAQEADKGELAEHLRSGAVFFNEDGSVMDPLEAYPIAGLEVPQKFVAS